MNTYTFKYSILEDSEEPIDYYAPATFLMWLNQQNSINQDINRTFELYREYVLAWSKYKGKSEEETSNIVRDSYIQVLREIVVNFSTEEERRFILNADFTDAYDLDVILPFFIEKIKAICLFYANTREEVKTAPIQHNLRGSNLGVENLVKKLIFDAARTNQIDYSQFTCSFPPVSAIARGLSVYVEELYDTTDTYFNNNPLSSYNSFKNDSSLRIQLSSSNLNSIFPNLYLNFKQAIIDAIREYPFFVKTLGTNNFSVNPVLSGTELQYLKPRDFISYLSGGTEELKLNVQSLLAPKFIGTDFYYLSTGETTTKIVSGLLFSTKTVTSSPTLNFLNKQYPSTASVPNLNLLFTEYELGRFFLPQFTGLLIHNTPAKTYEIDVSQLKPNSVYAFPDPNVIGNVSYGNSVEEVFIPLLYKIDLTWNKISRSNQFAFGDVLSNSYNPLYYGYQSQSQDLQRDISGLSKAVDNVQFWTGNKQEVWSNPDIWEGLSINDALPLEERQQSLLANNYTPVYWGSDIFGNEYGILKNIFPLKTLSAIDYNDGSVMPGSNTVILSADNYSIRSLYDRKYLTPGIFYFRGVDSTVLPASAALSAIFLKYPSDIQEEMSSSVLYFNMYFDTFVLETQNYVIIDSFNYNYDSNKIIINNSAGYFIKKVFTNNKLEKFAGEWYSENDNTLYLAFTQLLPYLSGSNYKVLFPTIYKTPLTNIKVEKVYPPANTPISINSYSLSAGFAEPPQINLTQLNGISFTKSEKKGLFNFTYLAKNLNGMPFFVNEQLKEGDWDIYLETFNPRLFRPYYFIYDNNYSNPIMPFLVKYSGTVGGTMGGQFLKKGYIDVGFESDPGELTYLFADGVRPVQINKPGTYIVQFDWESYNEVSIFVGCSGYSIKNVGSNIIFNNSTPNAVVLDTYGEVDGTSIAFGTYYNTLTSVSALALTPVVTAFFVGISSNSEFSVGSATKISPSLSLTSPAFYGDYNKWVLSDKIDLTYQEFAETVLQDGNVTCFVVDSLFNPVTSTDDYIFNLMPAKSFVSRLSGSVFLYPAASFLNQYSQIACNVERPTYPDTSVLKFTLVPSVSTTQLTFCNQPSEILRDLYITKTGTGSGVVFTDPYCIDCGTTCYQSFPYNSTVSIIASANTDSEFTRWIGGPCNLSQSPDCVYNVTDSYTVTAVFTVIPRFIVDAVSLGYIVSPAFGLQSVGRIYSTDGIINSPDIRSFNYKNLANVSLSCIVPISGWFFTGWQGGACAGISDRNVCSFQVSEAQYVSAFYVRYYDYNLTLETTTTASDLQNYGKVISYTQYDTNQINCSGRTIEGPTGTCTYAFTGTGQLSGIGTFITLSAIPARGYQFKEWINIPPYGRTYGDDRTGLEFTIASDVSLSALFDTGFYTLTIEFSGDGVGWIKSADPLNPGAYDEYSINADSGNSTLQTKYQIISGTVLTLYASAYPDNTIIGLSSRTTILGVGASAINITVDSDVSLVATFSAGTFYTLEVQRFGTNCGVISSVPTGINCGPGGGPVCLQILPKGTTSIVEATLTPNCNLSAYFGDSVIYRYAAGRGIVFNPAGTIEYIEGESFVLADGSLSLDTTGAPYISSGSINVTNGEIKIPMTTNRTVSAYLY